MKTINSVFLNYLTSALNGGADIDDLIKEYFYIDSNDPEVMKDIIRNILKPEFETFPDVFKQKAKDCLGFYLLNDKVDFERVFDTPLLPLETPKDPKLFYIWIWEVFFDNDSYESYNTEDYFELYDINEPLQILIEKKYI